MLVRLSTCLQWNGRMYYDGDQIDLPNDVAERYVATNQAERIPPPIETAALRTLPAKGTQDVRVQTAGPATGTGGGHGYHNRAHGSRRG